jgi:hypothetical protein
MYAANAGRDEAVRALLAHGADPSATDNQRSTPLMFAAQHGYDGIVSQLLAAGASPNARGDHGLTPLGFARQKHHEGTADLLIAAGAIEGGRTVASDDGKQPYLSSEMRHLPVDARRGCAASFLVSTSCRRGTTHELGSAAGTFCKLTEACGRHTPSSHRRDGCSCHRRSCGRMAARARPHWSPPDGTTPQSSASNEHRFSTRPGAQHKDEAGSRLRPLLGVPVGGEAPAS